MEAMEGKAKVTVDLAEMEKEHHHHHHHDEEEHCCCGHHGEHHHHEEDEHHCCGHHDDEHHHHEEDEHHCCGHHGEHHHHEEDEHHCCGHHDDEHHHHHEEGDHCCCGHHGEHHHHHADEVFTSWGVETHKKFTVDAIREALFELNSGAYGVVLRAKGIVEAEDSTWIHFDFVPGEMNLRTGGAAVTGKLCVIGAQLQEDKVAGLFGV